MANWDLFKEEFDKLCLTEPLRHRNDLPYFNYCSQVFEGSDDLTPSDGVQCVASPDDLYKFVYPNLDKGTFNFRDRILAPTNYLVDQHNEALHKQFRPRGRGRTAAYILRAADSTVFEHNGMEENTELPPEALAAFRGAKKDLPPSVLRIKRGELVVFIRNLNVSAGVANGTLGIFVKVSGDGRCALVNIFSDVTKKFDVPVLVPRIFFDTEAGHVKLRRRQYPLRLAWAMTIHKSQGQTLGRLGLDLRNQCFTFGQLGVAFSRASRGSDVRCLCNAVNIDEAGQPVGLRNPVCRSFVQRVLRWEKEQKQTAAKLKRRRRR